MEIQVRNLQRKHSVDRRRISGIAERSLKLLGLEEAQVSVALVSDKRIRELNRRYRRSDATTDVLAFPQRAEEETLHPEVLGDIVISTETAARNAERHRRTLEREIGTLVVHGLLHLVGLDHAGSKAGKEEMDRWTRKILRGWK